MSKVAVSITLAEENLVWLKGCAGRGPSSVSAVLDELISQARAGQLTAPAAPRSVVGTIDLPGDDPLLSGADDALRGLFYESLMRPSVARESQPKYGQSAKSRKRRTTKRG